MSDRQERHLMKTKSFTILILTFGLLLVPPLVAAQERLADKYDTKKTLTLTGTLTRMWFAQNTPFWIVLETREKSGKQKWVVVGNSMVALRSAGWVFAPSPAGTLNMNEEITVTVYLPKIGSKATDELAAASPQIAEELKTARLAHGIEITLPSGRKVIFGARR